MSLLNSSALKLKVSKGARCQNHEPNLMLQLKNGFSNVTLSLECSIKLDGYPSSLTFYFILLNSYTLFLIVSTKLDIIIMIIILITIERRVGRMSYARVEIIVAIPHATNPASRTTSNPVF